MCNFLILNGSLTFKTWLLAIASIDHIWSCLSMIQYYTFPKSKVLPAWQQCVSSAWCLHHNRWQHIIPVSLVSRVSFLRPGTGSLVRPWETLEHSKIWRPGLSSPNQTNHSQVCVIWPGLEKSLASYTEHLSASGHSLPRTGAGHWAVVTSHRMRGWHLVTSSVVRNPIN